MTALADLGLVEAADAVARREVTSTALLEACLAIFAEDVLLCFAHGAAPPAAAT